MLWYKVYNPNMCQLFPKVIFHYKYVIRILLHRRHFIWYNLYTVYINHLEATFIFHGKHLDHIPIPNFRIFRNLSNLNRCHLLIVSNALYIHQVYTFFHLRMLYYTHHNLCMSHPSKAFIYRDSHLIHIVSYPLKLVRNLHNLYIKQPH